MGMGKVAHGAFGRGRSPQLLADEDVEGITQMTDIKDQLTRLATLTKGPEITWPYVSETAAKAVERIEALEAANETLIVQLDATLADRAAVLGRLGEATGEASRMNAALRYYERKAVDPVPNNKRSPMEHEHDEE